MCTYRSKLTQPVMNIIQVVARCARLPLLLAIAGSMPVVKGKGLTAGAWKELVILFEDVVAMICARGEQSSSLEIVLEASYNALPHRKKEEVLKTAVLAAGAVAPVEMLLSLWETEVRVAYLQPRG